MGITQKRSTPPCSHNYQTDLAHILAEDTPGHYFWGHRSDFLISALGLRYQSKYVIFDPLEGGGHVTTLSPISRPRG